MQVKTFSFFLIFTSLLCSGQKRPQDFAVLAKDFRASAKEQLLDKWYPLALDKEDGGYYSDITYNFNLGEKHDKMVVTQARHVWTNAVAAELFEEEGEKYLEYAAHGFEFLRDVMWDAENGGFHQLVSKEGEPIPQQGQEKTAYGNSFAIYGLASYYGASGNEEALELAKKAFYWLEEHSHDPENGGYFQTLELDGTPIMRTNATSSTSDIGYKDQNSSIHLLEAFTALYEVWPDELLAERLKELLFIIRDTITSQKGYMRLFFEADWTPVSFQQESKEVIEEHYYLDHVSFGHDVETAYLMLEASHALGIENDSLTLIKGKKMVDHALKTGWDENVGGFYDGGYYFNNADEITIVNADKNWWSQAEGLNSLLLMSRYFPEDEMDYYGHFKELWNYTEAYIMDPKYGGWYEWGLDETPTAEHDSKGHIWKAAYHNFRALTNCMHQLELLQKAIE
ncbi:AGE family epimerase/isomerase [Zunongwangia sp. F363]|uniref:AGE family epimerase/isomerase n=1 Tax=Autumnicola tepida TaxID=3075595 RepID=A0ABU3CBV6_9FLAO|nr:AGE family epimerase/isomerase [Zunongwangia sp. F363]MDT0643753.1 AGE family epimerase/isomerase [Zunongwangia sp. F363]